MDSGKRIYINGRFLLRPMTGVERYAYCVCRTMADTGKSFTLICPKTGTFNPAYNIEGFDIIRFGYGSSHVWEQIVLPFFFFGKKDYILYSYTGLGSILVPEKIMTIHDLSFLVNPSWFSKSYYWFYRFMTPLAARTSKRIITVSEFSKSEILRYYPFVGVSNIDVCLGRCDTDRFYRENTTEASDERYAIAVSSLDPRKNFARLIDAFLQIPEFKLKIVGGSSKVFAQTDVRLQSSANIEILGRVDDDQLRHLYNNASFYVSTSLYEGFGLPLVEARSCGCPLVVSDIPPYHEVCGSDAVYFNPTDTNNIVDTIKQYIKGHGV